MTGWTKTETRERKDTSFTARVRRWTPFVSDPGPIEEEVEVEIPGMPLRDLELLAIGVQIQRHMIVTNLPQPQGGV